MAHFPAISTLRALDYSEDLLIEELFNMYPADEK
jgi:hypothetical protein